MTIRAIQWGTNFENVLLLGELYNPVTDREYRDGSVFEQGPSGVETSWVTGRDYVLEGEVRWIPDGPGGTQSPVSGPTAFQEFLTWARESNAFRFVPDSTLPLFYVENCYLVEPRRGFGAFLNIKRSVQIKIRNASMDFHQALRGIMFEYAPGTDISSNGLALTLSSAAGRFLDKAGIVQTAAASILRDRHYDALRRTALFEEARTNLILQSEDLRTNGEGNPTVAWGLVNTTVTINATTAPDGALTADKIVETVANAVHSRTQTVSITAGRVVVASCFFKAAERTQFFINVFNGADAFTAAFDTAGSGSVTPGASGAATSKLCRIVAVPGLPGYWYLWVSGIVNAGSTAITCEFALRKAGTNSYAGTLTEGAYVWGCQAEQVNVLTGSGQNAPAFYIPTTTATVTRTTDSALKAWPWQRQPMWFYAKFIETGGANAGTPSGVQASVVCIGNYGTNLRSLVCGNGSGIYTFLHGNSVTTRQSSVSFSPAVGDEIELLAVVYANDSVQLFGRKNGGSTTVGAQSAAGVATPQYAYLNLTIAGDGGTQQGLLELEQLKAGAGAAILTIPAAAAA